MRRNRFWTAQALMGPRPVGDPASRVREVAVGRPAAMKEFYCGAIIHGCETRLAAPSEEEILAAVDTHARVGHGMTEVPAELAEQVRQGIRDVR
jgi:predicted small metal-binding protein